MNQDLISIIVPCYNSSAFLKDTFKSIINQTYTNTEIILVNDGSTDSTPSLVDELAKTDSRVKVVHKVNGGLSSARNAGLAIANGKYVYFIDSDDLINSYTIEIIHNLITKHSTDIVAFGFKRVPLKYKKTKFKKPRHYKTIISNGYDDVYAAYLAHNADRSVCMKLFTHDSLRKMPNYPNIFNTTIRYGEDVYFLSNYYQHCQKSIRIKYPLYLYRVVKTSMMHSRFKEEELSLLKVRDVFNALDPNVYKESINYIPSVLCFLSMDLIRKLANSDYNNYPVVREIYHLYKDNLKYLPKLKRLPLAYRFGTTFTRPVMYMMIKDKLKANPDNNK